MKAMKIRILIICLGLVLALVAVSAKALAASDLTGDACSQAPNSSICQQAQNNGGKNPVAGQNGLISKAANVIAVVGGVVAVIMIIISGFMFVTAGGSPVGQRSTDPNQLKKARATLAGALIGALVIALAWTITRFVTDHVIQ
jgi:hypothetical protein